jgi:hypothetical protein
MTAFRTVAAFVAVSFLNGSVALAACPAETASVCAMPIAMTVAPPARPAHIAARAAAGAEVVPASLTLIDDEVALQQIAPPRRPADLMTRRTAPAPEVEAEGERSRAELAPPRRPAHLMLAGTF